MAKADAASVVETLERDGSIMLDIDGQEMAIDKELVDVKIVARKVLLSPWKTMYLNPDTTITDDLMKEGLAREFVSEGTAGYVKQKDFEVTDRINIYYHSDETVKRL